MDIARHTKQLQQTNHSSAEYVQLAIRIITGFLLVVKGIYFISHSTQLEIFVKQATEMAQVNFIVNYIGFAHLFGGAFIMLGLLTRFAIVLQIPIMIGAVYFNLGTNAFAGRGEIFLSILLLILLIYILIKGSGKISMDYYRMRKQL